MISSFIFFFWNQLRVSLAVFGIIVLLKCPPLFHLHHPGTVGVETEPANIFSTDLGQDCFDRFQLVSWLSMPFCTSFFSCVQYFSILLSLHFITHNINFWTCLFCFFHMGGLLGLLPTSGARFRKKVKWKLWVCKPWNEGNSGFSLSKWEVCQTQESRVSQAHFWKRGNLYSESVTVVTYSVNLTWFSLVNPEFISVSFPFL